MPSFFAEPIHHQVIAMIGTNRPSIGTGFANTGSIQCTIHHLVKGRKGTDQSVSTEDDSENDNGNEMLLLFSTLTTLDQFANPKSIYYQPILD